MMCLDKLKFLNQTMERLFVFMSVMAAATVCELAVALTTGNVHILKDAMIVLLLVVGLWAS